jgi:hypothetical protein
MKNDVYKVIALKIKTFINSLPLVYIVSATAIIITIISLIIVLINEPDQEQYIINKPTKDTENSSPQLTKKHMRDIQAEILNGCGVKGITPPFVKYLRLNKIDVIASSNYKDFAQTKSFFIVYSEKALLQVNEVAEKLKMSDRIILDYKSKPICEFAFVIGSDYATIQLEEKKESNE